MKRFYAAFNAIIAISVGIIVLLGYFFNFPVVSGFRVLLMQWAVILAGVAGLIGIWNLFSIHLHKIHDRQKDFLNSVVLLFFLLLTAAVSLTPALRPLQGVILNGIMVPAEISLMAVLAVTLIYASLRLLRVRSNLSSILFLITALLILLGTAPIPFVGQLPVISDWLHPFISNTLAAGGARGILIGVALGTLTTGLRILFGADRPYGGK
ncbi:MAG TPA: hypothetical protein VGK00_15280 [Anaerolineales bacterium]